MIGYGVIDVIKQSGLRRLARFVRLMSAMSRLMASIASMALVCAAAAPTNLPAKIGFDSKAQLDSKTQLDSTTRVDQWRGASRANAANIVTTPHVRAELLAYAPRGVQAGQPLWLGLLLQHQPGWHTYWKNPGDSGMATQLDWTLPAGAKAQATQWPTPQKIRVAHLVNYGYEGTVLLTSPVVIAPTPTPTPTSTPTAPELVVRLKASWLVCQTECIPEQGEFTLTIARAGVVIDHRALFLQAQARQPKPFQGIATFSPSSQALQLRLQGLPAAWRNQTLEVFAQDAELIETAAQGRQTWQPAKAEQSKPAQDKSNQGAIWTVQLPLNPYRTSAPRSTAWVVKPAGANSDQALAVQAKLDGAWQGAPAAKPAPISPALEAALEAALEKNKSASAAGAALSANPAANQDANVDMTAQAALAGEASWGAASFWLALLSALVGGLILNFMPCVLPILAIKLLSFIPKGSARHAAHADAAHAPQATATGAQGDATSLEQSQQSLAEQVPGGPYPARPAGWVTSKSHPQWTKWTLEGRRLRQWRLQTSLFSLGIIGSFALLGAALLALRGAGASLGWGFQLQSPGMVMGLVILFLLISLNLLDVFELRLILPQRWLNTPLRHTALEPLASGMLAVLIAAPCTAPLMAASLGLAITLPLAQALLIFVALGLGMASPFVLVAVQPRIANALLRHLPAPGRWMQTLRHVLAWPILATVLWLLWVYAQQTSLHSAFALMLMLLMLAGWLWHGHLPKGKLRSTVRTVFVIAFALAAVLWHWVQGQAQMQTQTQIQTPTSAAAQGAQSSPEALWQAWTPQAEQAARASGRAVFINFTAAWCMTCQVNHSTTLSQPQVQAAFQSKQVILLRADWTRPNAEIAAKLAQLKRSGLPVYALYPAGAQTPQLLPEVLTPARVLEALAAL